MLRLKLIHVSKRGHRELLNSSLPGQNGRHFADDIFRCIFMNGKFCILIKISIKFVPKGATDNNPALVQIMTWHQIINKPLSEPILYSLTYICGTRRRWIEVWFSCSLYRIVAWAENCSQVNVTKPHWWEVNIHSGNGLVLSPLVVTEP